MSTRGRVKLIKDKKEEKEHWRRLLIAHAITGSAIDNSASIEWVVDRAVKLSDAILKELKL